MNRQDLIKYFSQPTYLGDSVYIHFDGYHFILETRNGNQHDPSNRIALEPGLINKMKKHQDEVYSEFQALNDREAKDGGNV